MSTIRQEVVIKAKGADVYDALTCPHAFQKMSGAPAEIDGTEGGAFKLFGGMIEGRNLQLVPDQRIVQAWRAGDWSPGSYSIIRFDIQEKGTDTVLLFEQVGHPEGKTDHLAEGWSEHYWKPLKKLLES